MFTTANWVLYYISLYVEAALAFMISAALLYKFAAADGVLTAKAARPRREFWLSLTNLSMWALASLLISYFSFYWAYPQLVNMSSSWFYKLLTKAGLTFAIPPSIAISESVPWFFYPMWFVFMILMSDMMFYWTHRLMHVRRMYQTVHLTHHRFTHPTAWCGYAFHIFEGALLVTVTVLISYACAPISPSMGVVLNMFTAGWSAFLHSGYDASHWEKHPLLRHVYTPSHHRNHHLTGERNYGLYFVWWDRIFTTEVAP